MLAKLPHDLTRVRLRLLRPDDLDAFHAYRRDPETARYQGWEPMTRAQASAFLRAESGRTGHAPGTWRQLGIAAVDDDRLVGDMGVWLSPDLLRAEFGVSIAPQAQGNGYGTECVRGLIGLVFSATSATEVVASADIRNLACLAVLARVGMRQVETRAAEYKGEKCVECVFCAHRGEN